MCKLKWDSDYRYIDWNKDNLLYGVFVITQKTFNICLTQCVIFDESVCFMTRKTHVIFIDLIGELIEVFKG